MSSQARQDLAFLLYRTFIRAISLFLVYLRESAAMARILPENAKCSLSSGAYRSLVEGLSYFHGTFIFPFCCMIAAVSSILPQNRT